MFAVCCDDGRQRTEKNKTSGLRMIEIEEYDWLKSLHVASDSFVFPTDSHE